MAGGIAPCGQPAALIDGHLNFDHCGILRFIEHIVAGVFVVEIVLNGRFQRDGGRHLCVGVIEISLRHICLRPGR